MDGKYWRWILVEFNLGHSFPKAVYSDGYNKALEDYHRLIADEIKNDPVNPYLLHLYNFNNHIKKCLTKR